MATRKTRRRKSHKMKTHKRKTHKMKSHKRKSASKKMKRSSPKRTKSLSMKAAEINKRAQWEAYKNLQKRCQKALAKLLNDSKRKMRPEIFAREKNHLLLLIGECNYMARECMRMAHREYQ